MSEEQKQHRDDEGLSYQSGLGQPRPNVLAMTGLVALGLAAGAALVAVIGLLTTAVVASASSAIVAIGFGLLFFAACVLCFVVAVSAFRFPQRWFYGGFLLGVGLMGLLEGICFSAGGFK